MGFRPEALNQAGCSATRFRTTRVMSSDWGVLPVWIAMASFIFPVLAKYTSIDKHAVYGSVFVVLWGASRKPACCASG